MTNELTARDQEIADLYFGGADNVRGMRLLVTAICIRGQRIALAKW
jgi:hypothetical protein